MFSNKSLLKIICEIYFAVYLFLIYFILFYVNVTPDSQQSQWTLWYSILQYNIRSVPFSCEGRGMLPRFFPLRAKSSFLLYGRRPGYILDESPAHRRTLTDGSGCLHKVPTCTSGATLGFSILLKDTSACSSVLPGELGFKPAIFWSPVNQLYPLSYSRLYIISMLNHK